MKKVTLQYANSRFVRYAKKADLSVYRILAKVMKSWNTGLSWLHDLDKFDVSIVMVDNKRLPGMWAQVELLPIEMQLISGKTCIILLKESIWNKISLEHKYALLRHELLHISYKVFHDPNKQLAVEYDLIKHDMPEYNDFKEIIDEYGIRWGEEEK